MNANVDAAEVAKFDAIAHDWWDMQGTSRPLHELNPLRIDFIHQHCQVDGQQVTDVGCGGGILSEGLARLGAQVTGLDLAGDALAVAREHAQQGDLSIDYQQMSVEDYAQAHPNSADVVTCMEMLEHVPDPSSVIAACSAIVRPGGYVFFSTLNRNVKSWLLSVVVAENFLKLLPRGTHDKDKFIKPSELARDCRQSGLTVLGLDGITYDPISRLYRRCDSVDVNYLIATQKT